MTPVRTLAELTPTLSSKLAATVVTLLAVGGVVRAIDQLYDRDVPVVSGAAWHLLLSVSRILMPLAGVVVLVGVWNLTGPIATFSAQYEVGTDTLALVVLTIAVLGTTYALTDLLRRATRRATDARSEISEHQREIIYRVAQVSLYGVAGAVVLGFWGVDLGNLLVGAGFLGIVVGLAARQTLGALIAGFVLMFSRPFEIGDWIEVGDHEGIVTDITVVTTRLQTFDGEYVMIPNDVVSGESVVNRSRKGRLRIEVEVGVDYEVDPEHAAEVAKAAVEPLDEILSVPSPRVVLKRFADSAVILGVRVWIDRPSARRRWRTRTAVVSAVKRAFEAEGLKIPFPQRELMARSEAGGFRLAGDGRATADATEAESPATESETTTDGGDR